jgi:inner membrane transporter RhtA
MNLCFYIALKTVPLGIGVAIEFTGPLAVAVIASRRAIDFVWATLAAAGIILILPIFRASAPVDLHGTLWALLAGACWGAYILLGQRAGASVHGGTVTALGMAMGALCVLPFGVAVVGKPLLNPASCRSESAWPSSPARSRTRWKCSVSSAFRRTRSVC